MKLGMKVVPMTGKSLGLLGRYGLVSWKSFYCWFSVHVMGACGQAALAAPRWVSPSNAENRCWHGRPEIVGS